MTNGNISPLRRRMAGDMTIRGYHGVDRRLHVWGDTLRGKR